MNNADMPTIPSPKHLNGHYLTPGDLRTFVPHSGLTKREHFAALAMQGMTDFAVRGTVDSDIIAGWAVEMADALLEQLERPQCP